jgi:hypothetical protein
MMALEKRWACGVEGRKTMKGLFGGRRKLQNIAMEGHDKASSNTGLRHSRSWMRTGRLLHVDDHSDSTGATPASCGSLSHSTCSSRSQDEDIEVTRGTTTAKRTNLISKTFRFEEEWRHDVLVSKFQPYCKDVMDDLIASLDWNDTTNLVLAGCFLGLMIALRGSFLSMFYLAAVARIVTQVEGILGFRLLFKSLLNVSPQNYRDQSLAQRSYYYVCIPIKQQISSTTSVSTQQNKIYSTSSIFLALLEVINY